MFHFYSKSFYIAHMLKMDEVFLQLSWYKKNSTIGFMMLFRGYPMHSHHMPCIMSQMLIFYFPVYTSQSQKLLSTWQHSSVLSSSSTENPWTRGNKIWWVGIPTFYPSDGWFWLHKLSISNQAPIAQDGNLKKAPYIDLLPSLSHSLLCLIFAPGITYQTTTYKSMPQTLSESSWTRHCFPKCFLRHIKNPSLYTFSPTLPRSSSSYKNFYIKTVHINLSVIRKSRNSQHIHQLR